MGWENPGSDELGAACPARRAPRVVGKAVLIGVVARFGDHLVKE